MHKQLEALALPVLGISPQSEDSHARFSAQHNLPFPLLVDTDKTVIKAYDVNGPFGLGVRRVTYLIGRGRIVLDAVQADFRVTDHLKFLEAFIAKRSVEN
ncbi:MAG: redoxin domain-containing protein [Pseudomonadales bacterium]|jgi:peroxiredoxin Q/BCP|nr:redoxin domain-containing protein [Pseudomonadales bacterium]